MKAYPESLRLEIPAAVNRGMPKSTVARVFGISRRDRAYLSQCVQAARACVRREPGLFWTNLDYS